MFTKLLVLVILGTTVASPVQENQLVDATPEALQASVIIVDDINNFKPAHADVQLTELVRSENAPRASIRYTLGSRQPGDSLVATKTDYASYGSPQNVKLTLTYPTSGTGAVVTHVLVDVQQSSTLGRGYVTAGGVGQRYIQIVIEAQSTTYFGYSAYIYGR